MAKHGETRPYRVRYEWPNGVKGTETRGTLESARFIALEICRHGAMHGTDCTITITHRETGETFSIQ